MATAAELVMFESAGCPYCRAWDREIGAIYPLSDLAAAAPLRRVDIDAERPSDLAGIDAIVFTPTFVLFDDGREVGRITGYIGEYQFWGLLDGMFRPMPRSAERSVAEGL
ncbi:MAG: thioredoxin fold domain-containing protein [Inquilinus sp.]|nr:thioredoxin fold domain-containing protein [Inquilinus sp.]